MEFLSPFSHGLVLGSWQKWLHSCFLIFKGTSEQVIGYFLVPFSMFSGINWEVKCPWLAVLGSYRWYGGIQSSAPATAGLSPASQSPRLTFQAIVFPGLASSEGLAHGCFQSLFNIQSWVCWAVPTTCKHFYVTWHCTLNEQQWFLEDNSRSAWGLPAPCRASDCLTTNCDRGNRPNSYSHFRRGEAEVLEAGINSHGEAAL